MKIHELIEALGKCDPCKATASPLIEVQTNFNYDGGPDDGFLLSKSYVEDFTGLVFEESGVALWCKSALADHGDDSE